MKPAPFKYHAPATVDAMVALLAEFGDDGKVIAGGQSLVPTMNFRLARPGCLFDLNGVTALDFLRAEGGKLRIGALARHAAFHRAVVDGPLGRLLADVVQAHRPLSDPPAGHVLRQRRTRRSGVRMVRGRRDTRGRDLRAQQRRRTHDKGRRKAAGECVGFGLGIFVEKTGLGPADKALIEARPDGTIEIVTGAASVGQGIETAMAQIASEVLGVPIERMSVIHGQTDRIDVGLGAFASRATVMTGCAVHAAAGALRSKAVELTGSMIGVPPSELSFVQDGVRTPDGAVMPLANLVRGVGLR